MLEDFAKEWLEKQYDLFLFIGVVITISTIFIMAGFVLYESMKDDLKKKEEEVEIKIKDVKNKNIKVIITKTELSDKKEV
jgi:hypothetical protein